jgi:uncharacterized protein
MTGMSNSVVVADNQELHRLEAYVDGEHAELIYRIRAGRLVLIHTGVPEALAGQGVGGELVLAAIGKATLERLTLVPLCPFARAWLERHPDAASDVPIDWGDPS